MRFEVLGPLQVWDDSTAVSVKSSAQRRILAALLTRAGGQVSVNELVDTLWPDGDPPANATKNVQSYVAKLKHALGGSGIPVIQSGPGGYRLFIDPIQVDAHEFAQNVRRAQLAHDAGDTTTANLLLNRALQLWRGRPYHDVQDWPFLQPEIERLNQLRIEALELGIAQGRYAELLPDLASIVDENPYQERPAALLMRTLHALGRQAEAQQVYHRTRTRLADELGVDPTSALRQQYEALLRGDSDELAPPPRRRAPAKRSAPIVLVDRMPWPPKVVQERQAELALLDALGNRKTPTVCAVTGARGVGKTQLAAAYARRRVAAGWCVVWVDASSRDQLVSGFAELADILDLRYLQGDSEHGARQVRRWLGELQTPALLVLDDAADLDLVREWLPLAGSLQVVVTSNRRAFGWLGDHLELDVFTPAQAHALLTECTGLHPNGTVGEVAGAVGHHPLALTLAAAVITGERLTYGEYVQRLAVLPTDEVLGPHEGDPYPRSMGEAVRLSLDTVERRDPGARPLIELISVLAASGVARSLLVPPNLDEPGRAARSRLLGILLDASLLTYREDGQTIVMHPLTSRVVREQSARDARLAAAIGEATALLGNQFRLLSGEWTRQGAHDNLSHLEALIGLVRQANPDRAQVVELLALCTEAIAYFHNICDFVRVNALNRAVLAEQERVLGTDDPATLHSRTTLAREYRQQGRLAEAIAVLEQTLAEQERILGADHSETLRTQYDLATTHQTSGQPERTISLLQQLIASYERVPGSDRLGLLVARKRLAMANRSLGRLEVATQSFEALIPELERVLGRHHAQTLRTRSELACTHRAAGRISEAIASFEHAVADWARLLGTDHPDVRHERDRLAGAYRAVGRAAEATGLFDQTLADWERLLGMEHPWTLLARNNVACAWAADGRLEEAARLLEQVLAEHERVLGAERPRSLNVRNNLGCVLFLAGVRPAEAVVSLEAALAGRERVLGAAHPDTATSRHNLAVARDGVPRPGKDPLWVRNGFAYATVHSVDETIRL